MPIINDTGRRTDSRVIVDRLRRALILARRRCTAAGQLGPQLYPQINTKIATNNPSSSI